MSKDFDAQTRDKAAGRTRVLLMDGHSSHYTVELLDYARAQNIIILGYPPQRTITYNVNQGVWKRREYVPDNQIQHIRGMVQKSRRDTA